MRILYDIFYIFVYLDMKNKSKEKTEKKVKLLKSVSMRVDFVISMKEKIKNLGIPDSYSSIKEFYKILDEYCNPNLTSGFSGKINIPEIQKNLEYILPMRKEIEPIIKLSNIG